MAEKVVLRSSTIDKHGDLTLRSVLDSYVSSINSEEKMRYLVNHRSDLPPIGYFDHAEILEENGVSHAIAEPITFVNRITADFDNSLLIEHAGMKLSYIKRSREITEDIGIVVDKNNFVDIDSLNAVGQRLNDIADGSMHLELNMRKSYLPDPQVVITLAKYYLVLYPLLSPFLKKFGEKLAEDLAADTYQEVKKKAAALILKLKESTRVIRGKMVPKEKVMSTIFVIPGSVYIELHLKSDDPNDIALALKPVNLYKVHQKLFNFQAIMEVTEIYFKFNSKKKWEFIYLINSEGQVLGTKSAFSNRDKLLQKILLSPSAAFSVGATDVKYEKIERKQNKLDK